MHPTISVTLRICPYCHTLFLMYSNRGDCVIEMSTKKKRKSFSLSEATLSLTMYIAFPRWWIPSRVPREISE